MTQQSRAIGWGTFLPHGRNGLCGGTVKANSGHGHCGDNFGGHSPVAAVA